MGGPPRDETTADLESTEELGDAMVAAFGSDAAALEAELFGSVMRGPDQPPHVWRSDRLIVRVDLEDGRVAKCEALSVRPILESPLAMIRRWLRL